MAAVWNDLKVESGVRVDSREDLAVEIFDAVHEVYKATEGLDAIFATWPTERRLSDDTKLVTSIEVIAGKRFYSIVQLAYDPETEEFDWPIRSFEWHERERPRD